MNGFFFLFLSLLLFLHKKLFEILLIFWVLIELKKLTHLVLWTRNFLAYDIGVKLAVRKYVVDKYVAFCCYGTVTYGLHVLASK